MESVSLEVATASNEELSLRPSEDIGTPNGRISRVMRAEEHAVRTQRFQKSSGLKSKRHGTQPRMAVQRAVQPAWELRAWTRTETSCRTCPLFLIIRLKPSEK